MRIAGKNFGPIVLRIADGTVVEADRPVRYMRGWPIERVVALAERWHWRVELSASENEQLEAASAAGERVA